MVWPTAIMSEVHQSSDPGSDRERCERPAVLRVSHDGLELAEPYWYHGSPADDPACVFVYGCELLRIRWAQGHDEAPSRFQLLEQSYWHRLGGGGNHDFVCTGHARASPASRPRSECGHWYSGGGQAAPAHYRPIPQRSRRSRLDLQVRLGWPFDSLGRCRPRELCRAVQELAGLS